MSTIAITPTRVTAARVAPTRIAATRVAPILPTGRAVAGEARLTRRGRLVVFLGSLFLVLAIAVWFGAGSAATDRPEPTRVVTVDRGRHPLGHRRRGRADAGDVATWSSTIERLNALDSAALQAGQKLLVPVAG